jgi:hypothetical protein
MPSLATLPPGPTDMADDAEPPTRVRSLDARRIERALKHRVRYRYVHPTVVAAESGWRVISPCCSRNVDPNGGVIDIAWLEPAGGIWRLHRKDHKAHEWVLYQAARSLPDLMDVVCLDTERVFWP